jgi:hypothetical protein
MGRKDVPVLFAEVDVPGRDVLRVCARQAEPSTDDVVLSVKDPLGYGRSILLDYDRVERLHAALGEWLTNGWPGVQHRPGGDARRAAEYAARVSAETARRAAEEARLAAPCAPDGDLSDPGKPSHTCWGGHPLICSDKDCRAPLHYEVDHSGTGWVMVDAEGRTSVDRIPAELRGPDGGVDWDRLAREDIGGYSVLSATVNLGGQPFRHHHRPVSCLGLDHPKLSVPECHGGPMRLRPDGWVCRFAGTVFMFAEVDAERIPA